jgi:hypothetical protein
MDMYNTMKDPQPGWKWRHESPTPEPDDLTQLNAMDDIDFTPSEMDAFEAMPPPLPSVEYYNSNAPCKSPKNLFGISSRPRESSPRSESATASTAEEKFDEMSAKAMFLARGSTGAQGQPETAY